MKKHIFTAIALLLAVMFVAPSVLSLAAYAADESNTSEVDIWETLDPAYRAAEFTSVQNRIAGDGEDIPPMDLIIVSKGYALYSDKYNGEVICLKLPEPDENVVVVRAVHYGNGKRSLFHERNGETHIHAVI